MGNPTRPQLAELTDGERALLRQSPVYGRVIHHMRRLNALRGQRGY